MGVVRYLANVVSQVEEPGAFSINAFPNPAKSEITLTSSFSGNGTITILDMTGRVAMQNKTVVTSNQKINIESLPAGIYSLVIAIENKQSVVSFVKL